MVNQMADEAEEKQEVKFDPKDNRFVFAVVLIDMDDAVRDVIGMIHLAAADPNQATQKALLAFKTQGLMKEDGKYSIQLGVIGPLPDSGPRILRPSTSFPADLLKRTR